MLVNTFLTLLIIAISLFFVQIAVALIRIERKLEQTIIILEEELIDIFGTTNIKNPFDEKNTKS